MAGQRADSEYGRAEAPVQQEQFTGERVYTTAKGSGTRCKLGGRRNSKTGSEEAISDKSASGRWFITGKEWGGKVERICTEPK